MRVCVFLCVCVSVLGGAGRGREIETRAKEEAGTLVMMLQKDNVKGLRSVKTRCSEGSVDQQSGDQRLVVRRS